MVNLDSLPMFSADAPLRLGALRLVVVLRTRLRALTGLRERILAPAEHPRLAACLPGRILAPAECPWTVAGLPGRRALPQQGQSRLMGDFR